MQQHNPSRSGALTESANIDRLRLGRAIGAEAGFEEEIDAQHYRPGHLTQYLGKGKIPFIDRTLVTYKDGHEVLVEAQPDLGTYSVIIYGDENFRLPPIAGHAIDALVRKHPIQSALPEERVKLLAEAMRGWPRRDIAAVFLNMLEKPVHTWDYTATEYGHRTKSEEANLAVWIDQVASAKVLKDLYPKIVEESSIRALGTVLSDAIADGTPAWFKKIFAASYYIWGKKSIVSELMDEAHKRTSEAEAWISAKLIEILPDSSSR